MNRGASALNAMGFLALASATPGSGSWALLLIGAGLAVGRWSERPSPVHGPLQRLGWASSALVLPMTLTAGFRTQVTYTLLAFVGFALALWRGVSEVDGAAASSDPKGGLAPL